MPASATYATDEHGLVLPDSALRLASARRRYPVLSQLGRHALTLQRRLMITVKIINAPGGAKKRVQNCAEPAWPRGGLIRREWQPSIVGGAQHASLHVRSSIGRGAVQPRPCRGWQHPQWRLHKEPARESGHTRGYAELARPGRRLAGES
jgi:hypothetical protein